MPPVTGAELRRPAKGRENSWDLLIERAVDRRR
jgi:hypothetical protein